MTAKNKQNPAEYIGKKYNHLVILSDEGSNIRGRRRVKAICDCGVIKEYCLGDLKNSHTKSCGCFQKEYQRARATKHSLKKHPIYCIWAGMKQRCYLTNSPGYSRYGGRGIKVCDEWVNNVKAFYDWSIKNGYKNGLTIDRFPNNDGNYEPSNCRWATRTQQNRNKKGVKFIEHGNKKQCLSEWALELKMNSRSLNDRLIRGWSVERAFTEPINKSGGNTRKKNMIPNPKAIHCTL